MNTEYVYQKDVVVNVTDVYGDGDKTTPEGWRSIAFRPPSPGDWYLCMRKAQYASVQHHRSTPAIILEKIPEIPQFPLSHTTTFEDVYGMSFEKFYFTAPAAKKYNLIAFRPVKKGELYVWKGEDAYTASSDYSTPHLIVTPIPPA